MKMDNTVKKMEMDTAIRINESTQKNVFRNKYHVGEEVMEKEEIYVKEKKVRQEITRTVQITIGENVQLTRGLNDYDRAVHGAVCTLVDVGITSFTTEQLYRVMCGDETKRFKSADCSVQQKLEDSLANMAMRMITIDCSDEGGLFGLVNTKGGEIKGFKGYLIPMEEYTLRLSNGKDVKGWKILTYPPLYNYARAKMQITTIAAKHLNIPLKMDSGNVMLREYLLDRIMTIKGATGSKGKLKKGYENVNTILFKSLYELLGEDATAKTPAASNARSRIIEKCLKIFDYWKSTGLITVCNYSYRQGANKPDAFQIEINPRMFATHRQLVEVEFPEFDADLDTQLADIFI